MLTVIWTHRLDVFARILAALLLVSGSLTGPTTWAQIAETDAATQESLDEAILGLEAPTFGARQRAFRTLVAGEAASIPVLEDGAAAGEIDVVEACVWALVEIAWKQEFQDEALAALDRLAKSSESPAAKLAESEARKLRMTDEERAIEALEAAGVEVRRNSQGDVTNLNLSQDAQLKWIRHLPKLSFVFLRGKGITNGGLELLSSSKTVRAVSISDTAVTDVGFAFLGDLPALRSFYFSGNQISAFGIRRLAASKSLSRVSWKSKLDLAGLEAISELNALSSLTLSNIPITQGSVDVLNSCSHLDRLSLTLTGLTDRQCGYVANLRLPVSLSISGSNKLTDGGWAELASLSLTGLSLFQTGINNDQLAHFSNSPELSSLMVYDGEVTDEGLMKLKAMDSLRYATFYDTKVTEEGAEAWKKTLPNLRKVRVRTR